MQGIVHHLPAITLRSQTEGMVYRRLNDNLVTRLCKHIDDHADALYNSGNVRQPLSFDIEAMMVVQPCHDSWPIVCRLYSIAEYGMFHALAQGINDKRRSLKVHVCNPQRQEVGTAITLGEHVCLECASR